MKNKKLWVWLVVFLVLVVIYLIYNYYKDDNIYLVNVNTSTKKIENINLAKRNKMKVYYPSTNYKDLNRKIDKNISYYITYFNDYLKGANLLDNQFYELNIDYDVYQYERYISYVFYVEIDKGYDYFYDIVSINYDRNANKVVDIDDLIDMDSDIIDTLSNYSKNSLIKDEKLNQNDYTLNLVNSATDRDKNNFKNFAFSREGLILFFKKGQVGAYGLCNFIVVVPYEKIEKIIKND